MRYVTHASPKILPHTVRDEHAWLLPRHSKQEPWYYCYRDQHKDAFPKQEPKSAGFYRSVDEPLRELVMFFEAANVPTGPSCAGHTLSNQELGGIFEGLLEDQAKIRTTGLVLDDPETADSACIFQDYEYRLPFKDASDFICQVQGHQNIGWLSFYPDLKKTSQIVGQHGCFEIVQYKPHAFAVKVQHPTPEKWQEATLFCRWVFKP